MAINFTRGAARELVDPAEVPQLRSRGVLVQDPRRERPRYFDGRFLAARDLIRDQQYFLTREADLGRAAGSGVAGGLYVDAGATPQSLKIAAGQGITPAGELVLLPHEVNLNLADIPLAEQLSVSFGLSRLPAAPLRSRTGLFILALRPVEFTGNPIGAYPSSLTGPRTVEDGDVLEAAAIVLIPYQDDGAPDDLLARRGKAARTIFTLSQRDSTSVNVLPLAMLALQANSLVWVDEALVRRELGASRGDLPGLGFAPRALRLAHLMQHQVHLADVVAQLHGRSFPAATQFPALPPAGPLPPGTIDVRDFTQRYFPAEVDVDFSIIPDDELPALVEESLALPPIDFLASDAALDLTAVLVLAPVPRNDFRSVLAKLQTRSRALKPVAPNRVAQRKPLEILQRLRLPLPLPAVDPANPADAEWARLAQLPTLWFVRRRNLAYRDDLVGAPVAVAGANELAIETAVRARIGSLGLDASLAKVLGSASTKAASSVISLLASPRVSASPTLTAATLGALTAQATQAGGTEGTGGLDQAKVLSLGAEISNGSVGSGLLRLEKSADGAVSKSALATLAGNDAWRKLDTNARSAPAGQLPQLSARLTRIAGPKAQTETETEVDAATPTPPAGPAVPVPPPPPVPVPVPAPAPPAATPATPTAPPAPRPPIVKPPVSIPVVTPPISPPPVVAPRVIVTAPTAVVKPVAKKAVAKAATAKAAPKKGAASKAATAKPRTKAPRTGR
ncbi:MULTISPECIES: hypothetical protein [unclassified Rhizobacter]|uniref:hypothetical protein n=1 Tax=unclassified Rhizobacter TaxID=2640088 RepID=UPI000B1A3D91|nr:MULTISPECIES: hypothetical protein [unclassified Rhizobacter]